MEPMGKENETIDNKRKRLIFRSDHRGTKEMDIMLGQFAKIHVPTYEADALAAFDFLLSQNDPDLYNWVTGKESAPAEIADMAVFQHLVAHYTL